MSDCSKDAWKVPAKLGEPPYTVVVPDLGEMPDEITEEVTIVVWRGRRYRLVVPHEESCEVKEVDG